MRADPDSGDRRPSGLGDGSPDQGRHVDDSVRGVGPGATVVSRRRLRWEAAGVGLLLLGFVGVTIDVLYRGPLVALDHMIDPLVLQYVPHDVIVVVRRYVVLPGQRAVNVPPMAILAAVLAWRRRTWRPLAVPLVVMVFLALVVPGLKLWTGRTNPISGADQLFAGGTEYPSGHTINAIVVWGMTFCLAASLDWGVGRWLTSRRRHALTAAITFVIGCSVEVARTHWLSDVIGSLCFGIPLLWLVLRFGLTGLGAGERERRTPSAPARRRARVPWLRRGRSDA